MVPTDQWLKSLSDRGDRGAQMRSQSTRHYFKKLGIDQLFSRLRTPNDNPRIEAHFGTIKSQPVYPGYFVDIPAAVTYFTGFYAWYNDQHPLTTVRMLTPNQVHTGQAAPLLAARQSHQTAALANRRAADHMPFTLEALTAPSLPDVSQCLVYFCAGLDEPPDAVPHVRWCERPAAHRRLPTRLSPHAGGGADLIY